MERAGGGRGEHAQAVQVGADVVDGVGGGAGAGDGEVGGGLLGGGHDGEFGCGRGRGEAGERGLTRTAGCGAGGPQGGTAVPAQAVERAGGGQLLQDPGGQAGAGREVVQVRERPLRAEGDDLLGGLLPEAGDAGQAAADRGRDGAGRGSRPPGPRAGAVAGRAGRGVGLPAGREA